MYANLKRLCKKKLDAREQGRCNVSPSALLQRYSYLPSVRYGKAQQTSHGTPPTSPSGSMRRRSSSNHVRDEPKLNSWHELSCKPAADGGAGCDEICWRIRAGRDAFCEEWGMHQVRSFGGRAAPKNSYRRLSVALERLEPSTAIRGSEW